MQLQPYSLHWVLYLHSLRNISLQNQKNQIQYQTQLKYPVSNAYPLNETHPAQQNSLSHPPPKD